MRATALKVSTLLFSMWSLVVIVPDLGAQETPALQQDDRSETTARPIRLRMTPAVACRSIDGYDQYEKPVGGMNTESVASSRLRRACERGS